MKKLHGSVLAGGLIVAVTLLGRRLGYRMGGDVVVRCRRGHLFTTLWIPLASVKAVRLGPVRLQYCPVGRHWSLVSLVREETLTPEERLTAARHHDVRVP
jgi:hypothetical protein